MSFLISALLQTKAIIVSDKMITMPDGTHGIMVDPKFGTLPCDFILGWSGNSEVAWQMVRTFGSMIENEMDNFESFSAKVKSFKESFDPIYNGFDKDLLGMAHGSAQLQGIGLVEKRLTVISVNYCPSKNDGYEVIASQTPGTVILSSVDDNVRVMECLSSTIPKVLDGDSLSDRRMRKIFKGIYKELGRFDPTISHQGHMLILREDGGEREFDF